MLQIYHISRKPARKNFKNHKKKSLCALIIQTKIFIQRPSKYHPTEHILKKYGENRLYSFKKVYLCTGYSLEKVLT